MNKEKFPTVTLKGIYADSLGGFLCIRGFAKSKSIADVSYADFDYQRDLYRKHEEKIKLFLSNKQSLFFPEIVLSYTIAHDFSKDSGSNPLEQIRNSDKGFLSNIDGTKIVFQKNGTATITLKEKCLKRIDGNHRLTAIEQSANFHDLSTPFCILILPNDEAGKSKKDEMTIFHNINSMSIILTPEEKLKGLMKIFSADELEKKFGKVYSNTKQYMSKYGEEWSNHYPSLEFAFKEEPYTIVLRSFEFINEHLPHIDLSAELLHKALLVIASKYFENDTYLSKTKNKYALLAYIFYCSEGDYKDNSRLKRFVQYVIHNKLYLMKDFDPASIIDLFNNVSASQKKQIFIAMPFMPELNFVYTQIIKAVKELNREYVDLDIPDPKRIDKEIKGMSYDLMEEICNEIDNAGLIIADLTYANPNVYYEAGFAYGLMRSNENAAKILYLISNPQNPEKPYSEAKFDVNHFKIISYSNDGNGANKLNEDLRTELMMFYGIK